MPLPSKLALCVVLVLSQCCCQSTNRNSDKYRDGQVWRYHTRSGEEQSRLVIEHAVKDKGKEIIFVDAYNLHITNPSIEGEWTSFTSFPFTREALDASVTELEPTTKPPKKVRGDISSASPSEWQKNRGEPFRVPVAEFVQTLSVAKLPNAKYDAPLNPPLQDIMKKQ